MKTLTTLAASLMLASFATAAEPQPGCVEGSPGMAGGAAPGASEARPEKVQAKVEIQATVVAKQREYRLTQELKNGQAAIKDALTKERAPALKPPAVDLELELKNTSRQPVTIIWGGDQSRISLTLKGPGALNGTWPMMMTMDFQMGQEITLAPGASHRVPIKSLGCGPRNIVDSACWWTLPGDYQVTVSGSFTQGEQQVKFTAPPVTLKVTEPK